MPSSGPGGVPQVTPAEAFALLESGAQLLDVREQDEWMAGHAPGAVHVPLGDLAAAVGLVDRERTVVVICRSGRRSDLAADALRQAGFDACNLSGGMQAWQQAGGAVQSSAGLPGSVI